MTIPQAWKNERYTFDVAAALAQRERGETTSTVVPSLRVQLVSGMVGFAKPVAALLIPIDDLLSSSTDGEQAFRIGHSGTIVLKARRVEGTLSTQNVGLTSCVGGEEQHLVCQLAKTGAQKRLVIRSRLALQNSLPVPLQVEFAKAPCSNSIPVAKARHFLPSDPTALADLGRDAPASTASARPREIIGVDEGECSFIYRYIPHESCSQFDSLPLTYLTIPDEDFFVSLDDLASDAAGGEGEEGARVVSWARFRPHDEATPYAFTRWFQVRHLLHRAHFVAPGVEIEFVAEEAGVVSAPSAAGRGSGSESGEGALATRGVDGGVDAAHSFHCFVACAESPSSQSLLTTLRFLSPLIVENVLPTRVALRLKSFGATRGAEEEGAAPGSALSAESVPLRTCVLTLAPGQRARVHALALGIVSVGVTLIDLDLESSGAVTEEPAFTLAPRSVHEWVARAKACELTMGATVRDARDASSELCVFLLLESGRGLGCGSWLQVYCPYVVVNASGHRLRFRSVDSRSGGVLHAEKVRCSFLLFAL